MLIFRHAVKDNVLLPVFFMGLFMSIFISSTAFAAKPPNPSEQSVPVQLRLIRTHLDQITAQVTAFEGRLTTQMTALEDNMNGRLSTLQLSADNLQGRTDALQLTADDIYDVVTEVNIDMTTQLCFDAGAKFEGTVGIHDEAGIGWPNVLSAKAIVQGEGGFGGELGVVNQICIQVPLYSVASNQPLFTNGQEFDDLIAALALPSQSVVPIIADVYTALMPTPDEAFQAMGNVTRASTGYDVYTGITGYPNPIELLRPDVLLDPIIPQAARDFVNYAPTAVADALLDPCGTLENTPIGAALKGRPDIEFLCSAQANALQSIIPVINGAVDIINDVVDPLGLYH